MTARSSPTLQRAQELDDLARYFEVARRFPPLSREEEHAAAVRARGGDAGAKEKLVRHNLALVFAVARKQYRGAVRLDDVVQEGNLGLIRAAEKFDPDAGTRFTTYAVWWIRAYIGKYLREARSNVRPRSGTIAGHDLSLDAPIGDDDEVSHLGRLQDGGPGPEEDTIASERDQQVRDALARVRRRVGPVAWDIIHSRLRHTSPATLQEIGDRWGLSRERVRQLEHSTKELLYRHLAPAAGGSPCEP